MFFFDNTFSKIAKYLELKRPIIIFDCETTGLSLTSDRVISLAYIKIWPDGRMKKDEKMFDPETKIDPEATAIHGIRNRQVRGKPKFKEAAAELWEVFRDCHYSGFNVYNFDLPMLRREFIRQGMDFEYGTEDIIDSKKIYERLSPRTLSGAYEHYCRKELKVDRSAMVDAEAAAEILARQLEKYSELRNVAFINRIHEADNEQAFKTGSKKFYWVNSEAYFYFSKYKNKKLSWVAKKDPKFLEWILGADFSEDTKNIVRAHAGNLGAAAPKDKEKTETA